MGILNVTPDSFSDGSQHNTLEQALVVGRNMAAAGVSIIDIGGESTRPYAEPVTVEEELTRVIPVIQRLAQETEVPISIDTSKAEVARQALAAGAEIINDVSGLEGDPKMIEVAQDSGAGVCVMHMQGTPQTMQNEPQYINVTQEVHAYLTGRKIDLIEAGIDAQKICLDPGLGFGKNLDHNLELIKKCSQLHDLGCPLLVGHSRKGFVGTLMGDTEANRDSGTLAISLLLREMGVQVVRVHAATETVQAFRVWEALKPSK